jgi:hypothetical protein
LSSNACFQSKATADISKGGVAMQNNSSKQESKEIRFLYETVEAKKVSLIGELNKRNPDADPVPVTSWDESPDSRIYSQVVPFPSHKREDEPNSFHF